MSTGHRHRGMGMGHHVLEKLLSDREVRDKLYGPFSINRDYDIPYLAGYSTDGKTIYIDRHLPDKITFNVDGKAHTYFPANFLPFHERFEKAVMDALGWAYPSAHEAATGYERRAVLAAGIPWEGYQHSLKPYIKADEHEALKKVPKDLDLRPYYSPPPDEALLNRIKKGQGGKDSDESGKVSKKEVNYSEGMAKSHCGPVDKWPRGQCHHFEVPHSCTKVKGYIKSNYWCKLWESLKEGAHEEAAEAED